MYFFRTMSFDFFKGPYFHLEENEVRSDVQFIHVRNELFQQNP